MRSKAHNDNEKRKGKHGRGRLNEISTPTNVLFHLIFIAYALTVIFPFLLTVSISFSNEQRIIREGFGILPKGFTLAAYKLLLNQTKDVLNAYGISLFQTVVGTVLTVLNVVLYAYPLSRRDFRYRTFFTFFMFITMLFGGGLVPWYLVCTRLLHLRDTLWALVLPVIWSPWWVIITRTFIKTTIPEEMLESARIDGAGEWLTLFKIVIPLSAPVIATTSLFISVGLWNEWFLSMIFIDTPAKRSLQYLLQANLGAIEMVKNLARSYGTSGIDLSKLDLPSETAKMAMAVLAIGPMIFVYPFVQKYFVKGMTIGSIKG